MALAGCAEGAGGAAGAPEVVEPGGEYVGEPGFVLGTHETSAKTPSALVPIEEGDRIEIVEGPQGLFMVVLGFKSRGLLRGALTLTASLDAPEGHVADLTLEQQRTVEAADGWDYYYDFWLVVFGELWQGRKARLAFTVEDERGERVEVFRHVQLGEGLLPTEDCPEQGPAPSDVVDLCEGGADEALVLAEGELEALSVAADRQESFDVAARDGAGVRLFHVEGETIDETAWPAEGVTHGPHLVQVGASRALIWGREGDTWLGVPGRQAQLIEPDSVPEAAFAAPGGFKVLGRREMILELQAFDEAGERNNQHFVNNVNEVDEAWLNVEGEEVLITYTAPVDGSPLFYQTSQVAGGQCSIPAPLGSSPGADAEMLAASVSYGYPLFAWAVPPSETCARRASRVLARLPSGEGFEAESWLPFGTSAAFVPREQVAALVTAYEVDDAFEVGAQFIDVPNKRPGSVGVGLRAAGEAPLEWAVDRLDERYVFAWAGEGALQAARFCFE